MTTDFGGLRSGERSGEKLTYNKIRWLDVIAIITSVYMLYHW